MSRFSMIAAAAALALVASGSAFAQQMGTTGAATSTVRPAGVRLEMTDEMGPVLADARGLTLYTWRGDRKPGESLCGDTQYSHVIGAGGVSGGATGVATGLATGAGWA